MGRYKYYFTFLIVLPVWLSLACAVPFAYIGNAVGTTNPYQEEFVITQEAIDEASLSANTPYEVEFDEKTERIVSAMEKRHFKNPVENETDEYRIERLESELMGKVWRFTPLETRIRRLKLASSRTMLKGQALPPSMSNRYTQKRIHNDSIELKQKDQVGIIDGLLKVYAPEFYQKYKESSDRRFELFAE